MNYIKLLILLVIVLTTSLKADPVSVEKAAIAANTYIKSHYKEKKHEVISDTVEIKFKNEQIAYVFFFKEIGYVKIAADDYLPPMIVGSSEAPYSKERVEYIRYKVARSEFSEPLSYKNKTKYNEYKYRHTHGIILGDIEHLFDKLIEARNDKSKRNRYQEEWDYYLKKKNLKNDRNFDGIIKTRWDQRESMWDYELLTPMIDDFLDINQNGNFTEDVHTPTGCIPLAMAQISKFYSFPTKAFNLINYTANNSYLAATLPTNTTFDYSKIPLKYYNASYHQDDIARLIICAGISIKQNYGLNGSFPGPFIPYSDEAPFVSNALKNSFCFNSSYKVNTDINDSFETLVKNEIDNNRPILYSFINSSTDNGNHMGIIDAYDNFRFQIITGWENDDPIDKSLSFLESDYSRYLIYNIKPSYEVENTKITTEKLFQNNAYQIKVNWGKSVADPNQGATIKGYNVYRRIKGTNKDFYKIKYEIHMDASNSYSALDYGEGFPDLKLNPKTLYEYKVETVYTQANNKTDVTISSDVITRMVNDNEYPEGNTTGDVNVGNGVSVKDMPGDLLDDSWEIAEFINWPKAQDQPITPPYGEDVWSVLRDVKPENNDDDDTITLTKEDGTKSVVPYTNELEQNLGRNTHPLHKDVNIVYNGPKIDSWSIPRYSYDHDMDLKPRSIYIKLTLTNCGYIDIANLKFKVKCLEYPNFSAYYPVTNNNNYEDNGVGPISEFNDVRGKLSFTITLVRFVNGVEVEEFMTVGPGIEDLESNPWFDKCTQRTKETADEDRPMPFLSSVSCDEKIDTDQDGMVGSVNLSVVMKGNSFYPTEEGQKFRLRFYYRGSSFNETECVGAAFINKLPACVESVTYPVTFKHPNIYSTSGNATVYYTVKMFFLDYNNNFNPVSVSTVSLTEPYEADVVQENIVAEDHFEFCKTFRIVPSSLPPYHQAEFKINRSTYNFFDYDQVLSTNHDFGVKLLNINGTPFTTGTPGITVNVIPYNIKVSMPTNYTPYQKSIDYTINYTNPNDIKHFTVTQPSTPPVFLKDFTPNITAIISDYNESSLSVSKHRNIITGFDTRKEDSNYMLNTMINDNDDYGAQAVCNFDADGDGIDDRAVLYISPNIPPILGKTKIVVYNSANTEIASIDLVYDDGFCDLAAADINNDGRKELLAITETGKLRIWSTNGYTVLQNYNYSSSLNGATIKSLIAIDDHRISLTTVFDTIIANITGNSSSIIQTIQAPGVFEAEISDFSAGDIDNDGDKDLVLLYKAIPGGYYPDNKDFLMIYRFDNQQGIFVCENVRLKIDQENDIASRIVCSDFIADNPGDEIAVVVNKYGSNNIYNPSIYFCKIISSNAFTVLKEINTGTYLEGNRESITDIDCGNFSIPQNLTISGNLNYDKTYQAKGAIKTAGSTVVNAANVTFQAGQDLEFNPGFETTEATKNFETKIETVNVGKNINGESSNEK